MGVASACTRLFIGDICSGVVTWPIAGGTLCLYTSRDPFKETGNEDASGILICDETTGVLVVADGLGGVPGGDKASATAVTELENTVSNGYKHGLSMRESILDGIDHANQAILDMGNGAGTTITAVELSNGNIRSYHVGDSMALVTGQKGKIKHQTISHSPIGYAMESGLMLENDAMLHDERHIISNVVGTPEMRVEIGPLLALAMRDTLLLGSDGLFDNMMLDEIINTIRRGPLHSCAEKLVSICHNRMTQQGNEELCKPDDMTFILYRRV